MILGRYLPVVPYCTLLTFGRCSDIEFVVYVIGYKEMFVKRDLVRHELFRTERLRHASVKGEKLWDLCLMG